MHDDEVLKEDIKKKKEEKKIVFKYACVDAHIVVLLIWGRVMRMQTWKRGNVFPEKIMFFCLLYFLFFLS